MLWSIALFSLSLLQLSSSDNELSVKEESSFEYWFVFFVPRPHLDNFPSIAVRCPGLPDLGRVKELEASSDATKIKDLIMVPMQVI